jgi:hypothetical protein
MNGCPICKGDLRGGEIDCGDHVEYHLICLDCHFEEIVVEVEDATV